MRRLTTLAILVVAALALAAASFADEGHGNGAKKSKMTMNVTTSDHGTCNQNTWATDTLKRTYVVTKNGDGSYTVRRKDNGTFVTTGPASPGACESGSQHGSVVAPGYTGNVHGYLEGTVTGGTFNPNGVCTPECGAGDFMTAFFTPGSQFTCNNGYAGCKFDYQYRAQRHQQTVPLRYRHWEDRGTDGVTEVFTGDIATG